MRRSSAVAVGLLAAGGAVVAIAAVRSSVLWMVDPGSEHLAPAGAVLVAAGIAVLAVRRRARPLLAAVATILAGIAAGAMARLVAIAVFTDAGSDTFVRYAPGTPPSISWTLLAVQVVGPALAVLGAVLVAVGIIRTIAVVVDRVVRRLRAA